MTTPSDDAPEPRSIVLEVEVPGTPEQVWAAIATGPGLSSWFVPARVAEQEGGEITLHFGPGMDETGQITAWEPPRRFAYGAPVSGERRLAYEWLVEARTGGSCVVRLVNSGFGSGAEWDGDYDATGGWKLFLDNLRLVLTHFPGLPSASILVGGRAPGSQEEAWAALSGALGVAGATLGQRVAMGGQGAPSLAGEVVRATENMLTLRLDAPAPGIAFLAAEGTGPGVYTSLYAYLFGPDAAEVAAREEPGWRAWMEAHFPAGSG
jgi:uncharacterized protein YndB with AHSA1/START domain